MTRIVSNRVAGYALLLLVGLLAAFTVFVATQPDAGAVAAFFNNQIYNTLMLGGALAMIARGVFVREERAAWLLLGAALMVSDGGDIVYTNAYSNADEIPFPGPADALYLAFFPLSYVAIVLLVRSRIGKLGLSLCLDAAVTGLTVAAVASALIFQTVVDASQGYSTFGFLTNLAYPLGDFSMLALVVGALAAIGWRFDRTWFCVFGGITLFAVADSIYLYQVNKGTYVEGTILDACWPAAAVLLGFAAWQPKQVRERRTEGWATVALPPTFALASVGVLVYDHYHRVHALAIVLACVALAAILGRLALTFRDNLAMLLETRRLNALQQEYIEEVGHVIDAANAVEAERFEAASLDRVAERDDALGNLARVFQRMARQVYEREQRLKAQVQALKIEIDEAKAARQVEEITDTDYFRDLQKKAQSLRLGDPE